MHNVLMEVQDLSYQYADGTQALKGINLQIFRHEKLAVMGSNGSGKSTLFLNLNGVYRPTQGKIFPEKDCWNCAERSALSFRTRTTSFSVRVWRGKFPLGCTIWGCRKRRFDIGWTTSALNFRSTRFAINPPIF